MCDLIEHECAKAERDLLAACRQSLAHGALLATRYALEEIDFSFDYDDSDDDSDDDDDDDGDGDVPRTSPRRLVQASSARLLRLTERVTAVALRSISAPDGANVGAAAADIAPDRWGGGSGQGAAAARAAALATYAGVGGTTAGDDFKMNYAHYDSDDAEESVGADADADESSGVSLAPRAQVIVTACWLTMKEVSLVIGELARRVDFDSDAAALDPEQLRDAGNRLLTTLLTLKHNGAIEKTLVGLTCLGERLLRSPDARLSAQPREWLETLFQRTLKQKQDVRDLIRRSAGIPFGFMAVFLAEPRGVPRTLLHEALEKLLNLAVRLRTDFDFDVMIFFLSSRFVPGVFLFTKSTLHRVKKRRAVLLPLASPRDNLAAVTKTGLPLLMRSEDDRRLNRTKNTLARTEPYRARGETNLLSFFSQKVSCRSSFVSVNLFSPFRVVSPSDARSTDSRIPGGILTKNYFT